MISEEDESLFEKRLEMIDSLVFGYRRKKHRAKKSFSLTPPARRSAVNAAPIPYPEKEADEKNKTDDLSPSRSSQKGARFVLFTSFASEEEKILTQRMMKAIDLDEKVGLFTVDLASTSRERLSLIVKRLESTDSVIFVFILGEASARFLLGFKEEEVKSGVNFFTVFARKKTLITQDAATLIKTPSLKATVWSFLKEAKAKIDDLCKRRD